MIIVNGHIELKYKSGGGIDDNTGYPVPPSVTWSKPIKCQYYYNVYSNQGVSSGAAFIMAKYEILVEMQPIDAENLKLYDIRGKEIGEFAIIKSEPLRAVGQCKILVS